MNYVRSDNTAPPRPFLWIPFHKAERGVGYEDKWGDIRIATGDGYVKLHRDGRIFGNAGNKWPVIQMRRMECTTDFNFTAIGEN